MKHTNRYAEEKILVFDGIHYLHIFLWLMGKRYDKLADHLVNINGMYPSKEAAIELLKSRTQRFTN